jgi:hypothetical protein
MALYKGYDPGLSGTSSKSFAIDPQDDVTDFPTPARYVYIGTGGNVAFVNMDNTVVVRKMLTGSTIDCVCRRINQTGTTASDMIGYE